MLYGFIFSLGLMGDSFKILGGKTAGVLFKDITNPISVLSIGANIGTTCTGLLAALVTGKINALQVALCHLSFNILGVFILYPIKSIREKHIKMAKFMGQIARKV